MSDCKIFVYKGKEYTEKELVRTLSADTALVERFRAQEQRGQDSDYAPEDIDTFKKKVEAMQQTMDVEVIYDDSISSSRLLGKNDPRTVAAGKPVILINPNMLFKTTAIHEFGHVFIDSFPGGLANPRLVKALKELEGTQLEADVKAAYPDLSPDQLKKEILVTAIGREGSQIFEDRAKASSFEKFKTWFFDFLRRTFGMERSEVTALSQDLLSNKVKEIDMSKTEDIAQEIRPLFIKDKTQEEIDIEANKTEAEKKFESLDKRMEKTYNDLEGTVQKVLSNQKKSLDTKEARALERKRTESGQTTRLTSIQNLSEKLSKYDEANKKFGFVRYLTWANSELNLMSKKLDDRIADNETNVDNMSDAHNWYDSFSITEDIQDLLEQMRAEKLMDAKEMDAIEGIVMSIASTKKKIVSKMLAADRKLYAELVADYDTRTDEQYKEGFRQQYKGLKDAGKTDLQEMEFIMQEMEKNKEEIRQTKIDRAEQEALLANNVLGSVSFQILSEKDMNSVDIGIVSDITDRANHLAEQYATSEAIKDYDRHKAYKSSGIEGANSSDNRKKYEGMFSFTDSGQGYFTSKYTPQFMEDRNELIRDAANKEVYEEKFKDTKLQIKKNKKSTIFTYSSNVVGIDGKKINRPLSIKGSKLLKVEGLSSLKQGERPTHVTYTDKAGESHSITLEEAIARSEVSHWTSINTTTRTVTTASGIDISEETPIDKYLDKNFADMKANNPKKFAQLVALKEDMRAADRDHNAKESLIRYHDGNRAVEFMRLPGMMKSQTARVLEGQNPKTIGKSYMSRLFQTQADDYDTATKEDFVNYRGGDALGVPVKNRARLAESDQSLDLHTMVLQEKIAARFYKERKQVESSVIIISEVMKEKEYPVLGKDGKERKDAQSKLKRTKKGGESSLEYRKVRSILENKVYGITSKEDKSFKVGNYQVDSQQLVKNGLKYFGSTALVFNFANSIVNTTSGTISQWMDAVGGDVFGLKDLRKAGGIYSRDMINIMKDFGSNVATSKTNMLLNFFNVMGPEYTQSDFEEGTRARSLADMNSLRPLAKAGEHMMQSKAMYAILESIKAMNGKGQFIDKNGKVVKDKKKAASMNDMISFKKKGGKVEMVLDPLVVNTTFTQGGGQSQILFETRNLIRSKVDEMHGQYTSDIQAHAQRSAIGKMGFFLRKWTIPLTLRRYRGIKNAFKPSDAELSEADQFYSRAQKTNIEGYHVSALRFMSQIVSDARKDKISVAKSWNKLTPKQKAGVKKSMTDVALMVMVYTAAAFLNAEADDDDDMVFWAYLMRRQQSELTFFVSPPEMIKIGMTPTAASGNFKNITKFLSQLVTDPMEEYQVGDRKGTLKIKKRAKKLFPVLSQLKDLQDFKDARDYINSAGF